MRIEEVVGKRIREVREVRGMTQEEFGQQLAVHLGKPWPRQAVHVAEKGQRSFTALELLACSIVLGCDIAYLFRLPSDLEAVHTPAGELTRKQITDAERTGLPGAPQLNDSAQGLLDEIEETLRMFAPDMRAIAELTGTVAERTELLQQYVSAARRATALEQRGGAVSE